MSTETINRSHERNDASSEKYASVLYVLDDYDTVSSFELIQSQFQKDQGQSMFRQDMSAEEFVHDAKDPSVTKIVVKERRDGREIISGFMSIHTAQEHINWLDMKKVKQLANLRVENELYTIGTLAVSSGGQGLDIARLLFQRTSQWVDGEIQRLIAEGRDLDVLFDTADYNASLPRLIELLAKPAFPNMSFQPAGVQQACLIHKDALTAIGEHVLPNDQQLPIDSNIMTVGRVEDNSTLSEEFLRQRGIEKSGIVLVDFIQTHSTIDEDAVVPSLRLLSTSPKMQSAEHFLVLPPMGETSDDFADLKDIALASTYQSAWVLRRSS